MKKAYSFRLHEDLPSGLNLIRQLQHLPKNKLVDEAGAEYVTRHTPQTWDEPRAVLRSIKSYQKSDPDFTSAIAAFADAEATQGKDDTTEGQPVSPVGPVTQKLR